MTQEQKRLPPAVLEAMNGQRKAFVDKFGREPGPDDPVFFDPDCDAPTPLDETKLADIMLSAMRAADVPGHLVYAFEKTGYMLTAETYAAASRQVRRQWDRAVEEYLRQQQLN